MAIPLIPILLGVGSLAGGYLIYRKKEEIESRIGTFGSGLMFIAPGIGLMYAGAKLFPPEEKIAKTALTISGIGLTGLGTFVLAKPIIDEFMGFSPPTQEESETQAFPVRIIEPDYGERWSTLGIFKHDPEVEVTNQLDEKRKVWVGFTVHKNDMSKIIHLPAKLVYFEPRETKRVLWKDAISGDELIRNGWTATSMTWNMYPTEANVPKGLKMLGRDDVQFTAALIGIF